MEASSNQKSMHEENQQQLATVDKDLVEVKQHLAGMRKSLNIIIWIFAFLSAIEITDRLATLVVFLLRSF